MAWHQDFNGIPLEGKHINYSFLFQVSDEENHIYDTICEKESIANNTLADTQQKYDIGSEP